jgi:hypothetical protein
MAGNSAALAAAAPIARAAALICFDPVNMNIRISQGYYPVKEFVTIIIPVTDQR